MKTYIDMDGVIVDFFSATHQLHNRDIKDYPVGQWHMERVFNLTYDQLIKDMGESWWASLPKTSYADYIMSFIKDPVFLTTHMDGRCVEGKERWIHKYYPKVPLVLTRSKGAVACSNSVLIDDRKKNTDAFIKGGGKGIVLVPTIWNERSSERGNIEIIVKQEYRKLCNTK